MQKNHIDIVFFERPLVDLKRYALKIAEKLKIDYPEIILATISLELPAVEDRYNIDFCFLRKQIKNIDRFLNENKVQVIVFTNPRIPDMEMILHAHKNNIKTVLIQEGVIFEGANINDVSASNFFASLKFIPKTIYYFGIMYRMCKYDKISYFRLLKEIFTRRKNITSIVAHYFSPYLISDYVFTMGKYWEDYYVNVMKYPKDRIRIMGDHDLDNFSYSETSEKAICYIATVLVEDGTRTKAEFDVFMSALAKAVDIRTPIYIKLHPRSDKNLYNALLNHNVKFIRQGTLPSTNIYIGHRSTLIARALYESDNLIIWKFPKEREDFFEQFATYTVETEDGLVSALEKIDISKKTNQKRVQIEDIYWRNPKGAIDTSARMIIQYMINGKID